ncbi:MAG: immunoglobulin domain-containing protein [Verrucomicrobiota bacterium]
MKPASKKDRFGLEVLEPRILLSGEGLSAALLSAPAADPGLMTVESAPATTPAGGSGGLSVALAYDPAAEVNAIFEKSAGMAAPLGPAPETALLMSRQSASAGPGPEFSAAATWSGGGSRVWEINDADGFEGNVYGGKGKDPGWDFLSINGALTIAASSSSKFKIEITSLDSDNTSGQPVHYFDNTAEYLWPIVSTTGGITGFDPAAFNLDLINWKNPVGSGAFVIEQANGGRDLALRFLQLPAITQQPQNLVVTSGSNATFSVTVTGSSAAPTYQWRFNGAEFSGANSASYTVTNAQAAHAGLYSVQVTHSGGTEFSAPAILAVTTAGQAPAWVEQGPDEISGKYSVEGVGDSAVVGAVQAIAVHPANPSIVYVGTVNGGVWRTSTANYSLINGADDDGDGATDEADETPS